MFKRTRRFFKRRADNAKTTAQRVVGWDQIQEGGKTIRNLWGQLLPKRPTKGREETFSNAMRRLKIDEARLQDTYRFYIVRFYTFYVFLLLALGYIMYTLTQAQWFALISCTGFLAICFAMCFDASFRLLQIRRRELISPSMWLHSPMEWMPPLRMPPATPPTQGTGTGTALSTRKE